MFDNFTSTPLPKGPLSEELKSELQTDLELYVAPSKQSNGECLLLIAAEMYKQWFLRYHDKPNIESGHFPGEPVLIKSEGPKTMAKRAQVHESLYVQSTQLLKSFGQGRKYILGTP
jgi:hypothetical protein